MVETEDSRFVVSEKSVQCVIAKRFAVVWPFEKFEG